MLNVISPALLWFLLGVGFLLLELLVPGFVLVFFGLGCWLTAVLLLFLPLNLGAQLFLFIVLSLATLFTLRRYLLTLRGGQHRGAPDQSGVVGKAGVVTETIEEGRSGQIKALGSFWSASSTVPIAKGQAVLIVGRDADSLTLEVVPKE